MQSRTHLIMTGIVVTMLGGVVSGSSAQESNPDPSETDEEAVSLAVEAVIRKMSLDKNQISVVHVSRTEWPDSSLGCPRPGVQYLQVLTPGSLVLLQGPAEVYRVHVAKGRAVVCTTPYQGVLKRTPKVPAGLPIDVLVETSRMNLAGKLGVAPDEIDVRDIESVTWADSSLGCPDPGREYSQMKVKGFRITLGYGRQQFVYHTDGQRVLPCPAIERK